MSSGTIFASEVKSWSLDNNGKDSSIENSWSLSNTDPVKDVEVKKTPLDKDNVSTWKILEKKGSPEEAETKKQEEAKLKQDINTYIIESYKVQWNKIIKDLSANLSKKIPDPEERILAYEKIQDSLELRIKRTETLKMSASKKEVLQNFLEHLISLLDKKIEELKE
jgi:hypothetical protein